MSGAKKRYDSKHKLTRIHLADYLVLKHLSQLAGISMAEALHKLIEHQAQLPLSAAEPVLRQVAAMPAFRVTAAPAYRDIGTTAIVTNGSKAAAIGIKPKGVSYE